MRIPVSLGSSPELYNSTAPCHGPWQIRVHERHEENLDAMANYRRRSQPIPFTGNDQLLMVQVSSIIRYSRISCPPARSRGKFFVSGVSENKHLTSYTCDKCKRSVDFSRASGDVHSKKLKTVQQLSNVTHGQNIIMGF